MASLGVVPVMSPTEANLALRKHGIGLIAETPADWYENVTALIKNLGYRAAKAQEGAKLLAC